MVGGGLELERVMGDPDENTLEQLAEIDEYSKLKRRSPLSIFFIRG